MDNDIALALIEAVNGPIAAPSANLSNQPPPTNADDVFKIFNGQIPIILDGGASNFGISSTIIDLTGSEPKVIRAGAINYKLRDYLGSG